MKHRIWLVALLSLLVSFALISSGCVSTDSQHSTSNLSMAPMVDVPADVQAAPVSVQEAYRFAAENPDVMTQLPCYCGCGAMGHTSNYACYVSGENSGGSLSFDAHALGCSICVDITQDTMRLLQDGKSVTEIRSWTFANFVF